MHSKNQKLLKYTLFLAGTLLFYLILGGLIDGVNGLDFMLRLFQAMIGIITVIALCEIIQKLEDLSATDYEEKESRQMASNGYVDILKRLYETDEAFQKYVDKWCYVSGRGRFSAFQSKSVQDFARERIADLDKQFAQKSVP